MDALKQRVAQAVERLGDELTALSHDIHAHPELAFEETHAAERLQRFLDAQGFRVEAKVGGLATRSARPSRPGPTAPPWRSSASTTPCPAWATPAATT